MADRLGNGVDEDGIVGKGYSEIIVKETDSLSTNIQFGNVYKTRAAYQSAIPNESCAHVSILVLGYNNLQEHTRYCVESILKYTTDIDYELVLLDNGSSDGTFEYFKSVPHAKKRIIRVTQNRGGNYGLHLAANHLTGRYVAMIPNDVYVTRNWLSNMLRCAESDEHIGFLAPASDNVSNFQAVNLSFRGIEEMQSKAQQYNIPDPRKWEERLRLMPAVALYKKECLDIVGSLDYAFQHDFSDDDISIRVRRAGYKIVFCGDVFVHHEGPTVTGTTSGQKMDLLKMGRMIFRQKYFGIDAWDDFNNFEPLMLSLVNPEEKRGTLKPEILGIDVMCGTPILQLKNRLRHADIFDTNLTAFIQDPKYLLDLKTICDGTVAVDRIEHLTEHFSPNSFDYILLGTPLNVYRETEKILSEMLSLLKTDGQLLIKLRNQFDVSAFLDAMKKGLGSGQQSVTSLDINNLNKILMQTGYAIQTIRRSLYNIDNSTKDTICDVLRKSNMTQDVGAAFNELIAEEYALGIMKNEKIQVTTSFAQTGRRHGTSFDTEISAVGESQTPADIALSKENLLSSHFQHDTVVQGMTSIIILTQNRLNQTTKCVKSIRKHTTEPHEIIFVDNGSTDGTVKWLYCQTKENKKYRLIVNRKNFGLAKGRNQGITMSQGEFILLMDSNVTVGPCWLSGMQGCLNRDPTAGIVGPMTNNSKGLQRVIDDSHRSVDHLDEYAAMFQQQNRHRTVSSRNIDGFCMLFRRNMTEEIGMLDERFDTDHFEDEDFCLRASLNGYRNYIAGDVFVHHLGEKECLGNRSVIDKKWALSVSSPEGKKLAVLKATELADDLYQKGKIDQAIEALINCIKLAPDAKEIYHELIRIFIELKKYSEAWEVVGSMPDTAKNNLKGIQFAGYVKEGLGLDDEAVIYADRMLSQDENYPAALNLKGVLAYKKDEKDKALDCFQKAIGADPGYGEAHTNLGVLFWGAEKKDVALIHMRRGFMLSPTVPDVSSLYYSVASSLGKLSQAEADFLEASQLYANNKNLAFLCIDILLQNAKFHLAMRKIEDALAMFDVDEGTLNAAISVRDKMGALQIEHVQGTNTLSLCMIVKNEEKHLAKCLRSVRDIVDEMIIVDTGSTDKSKDIAKVFGAKVFDFPWTGDFSAARNYSLQQATGDWVLILDADETISTHDFDELKTLIRKSPSSPAAYSVVTRNYVTNASIIGWTPNNRQYPEETGAGWVASAKVRLFPNRKDVFFCNQVHELLENSLRNATIPILPCNIVVHHYGKLDTELDSRKGEDYYLMGKLKYENDPTNVQYISELAKQSQMLNKHEEAVELWLRLISLLEANPQSSGYTTLARISYGGDPLSEIYTQLGLAYLMLDRCEEALQAARKAIKSATKLKESVHVYANCEIIAGSLEKAYTALEELLKTTPDYTPALFLMAVVYCLQRQPKEAQEILRALLHRGVQMTPSLNKIAKQLHTRGKKDEAMLVLNTTIGNKINNAETTNLFETLQ